MLFNAHYFKFAHLCYSQCLDYIFNDNYAEPTKRRIQGMAKIEL